MIQSATRSYESLDHYFDFICDFVGFPALHKHFQPAEVYSDGLRLHVDVLEVDKDAPTIVFVPGTAIYALCYAEFLYKLSQEGFNIVGLDPRGHGRSEGNRGDYTMNDLIKDTERVIYYAKERFGDNVSLMGSSQGGIVSFYIASKQDNNVKSVICQNFADLTWSESTQLTRYPQLAKYLKPLVLQMGRLLYDTQIPVSIYLDLEQINVKYFGNAKKFMDMDPLCLHSVSLRALNSLQTTEMPRPIEEVETPVMVFQGNADSIFPISYTQDIYDRLNCKKRFEIFEGLNHAIITEDPDVILPPIVDWLKEVHGV